MAKKTILCHFYNEEWILPFWLKHHRDIFDHGIMINYHSTDRSCDIIREYCPTWQIVESTNPDFTPTPVDREVEQYEKDLVGWRVALNATEFLTGNYSHLDDRTDHTQIFVGQWMFIDTERRDEPSHLNVNVPLYYQRTRGYGIVNDFSKNQSYGSVPRAPRSIHNHPIHYVSAGRHYPANPPSYPDLAIFYYGYASMEEKSIQRKMQIQTQCPNNASESNHKFTLEQLLDRYRKEQQPMSRDISAEIKPYIFEHEKFLLEKNNVFKLQTKNDITAAIDILTTALQRLQ